MAVLEIEFLKRHLLSSQNYFRLRDDRTAVKVGITLSLMVISFILIHIVTYYFTFLSSDPNALAAKVHWHFNLNEDGRFPERFNHGMLFICAAVFLYVAYESGSRAPLFFSLFFFFAWFDDSSQYHERVGVLISENFQIAPQLALRGRDFGELLAWALIAAVLLAVALWAYAGKNLGDDNVTKIMLTPIAALIFCGVIFDMAHVVINGPLTGLVLNVLEDGGEMLSIAAAVAASLAVVRNVEKIYTASGAKKSA